MYTLPIIAPDLRHEETIIQAARCLDSLNNIIENLFTRLDERIARNATKVKDLAARIAKAHARIENDLTLTKKALQIYSPARFPATHVLVDLPQTPFNMQHETASQHTRNLQTPLPPLKYEVKSPLDEPGPNAMHEKLLFYHVNAAATPSYGGVSPTDIAALRAKVKSHGNSLGQAPLNLSSSASLLRFNSEELAYSSTCSEDLSAQVQENWKRAKLYKSQRMSGALKNKKKLLEPAPHSLSHRQQIRATPAGELRYTPQIHEAPNIDLPMDLPSLEGIAEDINYTGLTVISEPQQPVVVSETQPPAATVEQVVPPPPPLPPATIAPPPPPPPPAVSATVAATKPDDTRSALMDAIRKAGGARALRAAAAEPLDTNMSQKLSAESVGAAVATKTNVKRTAQLSSGGDLMADLHNKLLMRRKGISGINSGTSVNSMASSSSGFKNLSHDVLKRDINMGNPVVQRLSALIPPPPPKNHTNATQHSDENDGDNDDDDDDDDWAA